MNKKEMTLTVFIGPPGREARIRKRQMPVQALVDPAADISIFPFSVVTQAYGEEPLVCKHMRLLGPNGSPRQCARTPLSVGVETNDGSILCAQIECLAEMPGSIATVGNDVLAQLGLKITLDYKRNQVVAETYNWASFEEEVGAIYRSLGARVKQNVNLAGFQIDILVEESTPSKQSLRLVIECKFYKDPIGNRIVNDFARVVATLKEAARIDRGVLVSSSGFTQDASLVAARTGIDLVTIDDLRQGAAARGASPVVSPVPSPDNPSFLATSKQIGRPPRVFVVMPFAPELDDAYHLGIREVVAKLNGSCERADEMQYVGGIVQKIYASIKKADIIIAEVSTPNPNVYYEVGFAHALGIPVVLLTSDIATTPFDLRGYNHIVYSSIVDLRRKLGRMLQQLLEGAGPGNG